MSKTSTRQHYSCVAIRRGFNFARSGIISACCFSLNRALNICKVDDPDLTSKITHFQNRLIDRHMRGQPPDPCKNCNLFRPGHWPPQLTGPFTVLTLNHYKTCNLKCVHCGYRRTDDSKTDTPHTQVLEAIKKCIAAGICANNPHLEIGGGEPSISTGIHDILAYAMAAKWTALINSNAAKFSPLFAEGVNNGRFTLILTPDAGSREVYEKIKGVDNFDNAWNNIGQYMLATGGKSQVKFILEAGNKNDVPAMIATSAQNNVKNLVLSFDMGIPVEQFEAYRKPLQQFIDLAAAAGIAVHKGAFLPERLLQTKT